jgi:hypothetical protein
MFDAMAFGSFGVRSSHHSQKEVPVMLKRTLVLVASLVFGLFLVACDHNHDESTDTSMFQNGPWAEFNCQNECTTHSDCDAGNFCQTYESGQKVDGVVVNRCGFDVTRCRLDYCERKFEKDEYGNTTKVTDSCGKGLVCNLETKSCDLVDDVKPDADTVDEGDTTTNEVEQDTKPKPVYPNYGKIECCFDLNELKAYAAAHGVALSSLVCNYSWVLPYDLQDGDKYGRKWNVVFDVNGCADFTVAESQVLIGFNVDVTNGFAYVGSKNWLGDQLTAPVCWADGEKVPVTDSVCYGRGFQLGNLYDKCGDAGF